VIIVTGLPRGFGVSLVMSFRINSKTPIEILLRKLLKFRLKELNPDGSTGKFL
jgi:hypothetical protein